jgi:tetratricopeptide (TPR) repeat protein
MLLAVIFSAAATVGPQDKQTDLDIHVLTRDRQHGAGYSDVLRQAWKAYNTSNNPKAAKLFQQVLNADNANAAERTQALFGLGINFSYSVHPEQHKAKQYFLQLVDDYPQNPAAPWAIIELACLQGTDTLQERQNARKHYYNILKKYPLSTSIHEAALRLASTYFYEIEPELNSNAVKVLEEHLKKYPDNPLASTMRFRLVYWYEEVNRNYEKGLEHALVLGELKMADPYRWPMQYWNIAQMYRIKFKKPAEAIKWYQKIIDESPRDYLVYAAKQFVKELSEENNK